MTLTLKQGDLAFVGKKAYLSKQVKKKNPSKGNIALALVSLLRFFFFGQILVLSTSQMCSLNFNHNCLLWWYDNINVGDDIKCKWIELFLYRLYSSQHLKWIKNGSKLFIKVVLKPKTHSCLRTTLMNFFDPLQMLTTVYHRGIQIYLWSL